MPADKEASAETPAKAGRVDARSPSSASASSARAAARACAVTDVDPDGVAAEHGLQAGDVILDAGGKPVTRPSEVAEAFAAAKADGRKAVLLRVKSGDAVRFLALPVQAAS